MTDLGEFLLARITEDEVAAITARERNLPFWVAQEMGRSGGSLGQDYVNRFSPDRVLAECDTKRRLIELTIPHVDKLLALPYVDHRDYRQEWKP